MFCTNCGITLRDSDNYCQSCGARVNARSWTSPEAPSVAPAQITAPSPSTQRQRKGNFIVKHWYGDYTLGISYWIFGVLTSLALTAIDALLTASALFDELTPQQIGYFVVSYLSALALITVWQLTGIWRSASKHVDRGGKAIWSSLVKLSVIIGILRAVGALSEQSEILGQAFKYINDTEYAAVGELDLQILDSQTEIVLRGEIGPGASRQLITALESNPQLETIHLNSVGGLIREAVRMYDYLASRQYTTYTSSECVSACTIIFLAGAERLVADGARLGFHSASLGDLEDSELLDLNSEFRRIYRTANIPDTFISKAISTPPSEMWYPDRETLIQNGIVDYYVDELSYGLSAIGRWRDVSAAETELLAIPLYGVIKEQDPEGYQVLFNSMVTGVQAGKNGLSLIGDVRTLFQSQVLPSYISRANASSLMLYMGTQIDEMKYFQALDGEICASFVQPDQFPPRTNITALLPAEMLDRDMTTLISLIESQDATPESVTESDVIDDLIRVYDELLIINEDFANVMVAPESSSHDPQLVCDATVAFIELVANPETKESSAKLIKYLFSSEPL